MIECEAGLIGPGEVILSSKWLNDFDDHQVLATVRKMAALSNHPHLIETHCSGSRNFGSIKEFLESVEEAKIAAASTKRKRELSVVRRREFSAIRAQVELALIARDGYVCSYSDCYTADNLTVDHIVALSKGGTDELENLRFLCRSHNSSKGDRSD